jgi:hypothetical protein
MEFVPGADLRQLLRAGPVPPPQVLAIALQVCDALEYAHGESVIHRDIKPENLLLDPKGRVKVADFGLAKLVGPTAAPYSLTGSHQVMGTPHYMAPEQWERPQAVDHRADIYALGVVLYELLTAELPLGRFAPPSAKAPVDPRLDAIILQALEKDPARRPPDVRAIRSVLESVAGPARSPTLPWGEPAGAYRAGERTTDRTLPITTSLARADEAVELARTQVRGPAAGLVVAGLATLLVSVGVGTICVAYGSAQSEVAAVLIWSALLAFPIGGILVLGGVQMRSLRSYGLAVAAAAVAMMPLTLGWFLGLPLGLWALLVLRRPEVREAFAAAALRPVPPFSCGRLGAHPAWAVVLCGFGVAAAFLPWAWVPLTPPRPPAAGPELSWRDSFLTGVETGPGVLAAVVFAALALLLAVWPWVPRPAGGRPAFVWLLAVAGLVVVLTAPYGFDATDGWTLLAFAVPLAAVVSRLWRLPGRPVAMVLGGWGAFVLTGLFVVLVHQRKIGLYIPGPIPARLDVRFNGGFSWQAPASLSPGPFLAAALALGLIALGVLEIGRAVPPERREIA